MNIGLVRHFKVDIIFDKRWYTPAQFNDKMIEYDNSPVIPNGVDLGNVDWEVCYSSTIPRAVTTAETIYNNEIIKTDLLREVDIKAFTNRNILLPGGLWHLGGRIAWYKEKKSQPEKFSETKSRADEFVEMILSSDKRNILCVSHGFFMGVLSRKLIKHGFKGEMDVRPRNGKLYVFSNQ